jgi:hypothetical protein
VTLRYIPLLQKQRELQGLPRNLARFREYVRTLSRDGETLDLPPLGLMNPMGKDHVTALLDTLLALGADGIAARAVAEMGALLGDDCGDFHVALVVADDLMGGWTNRYDYEFGIRFGSASARSGGSSPRWLKEDWITGVLWSSEPATERAVREALLTAIHRIVYVRRNGPARVLRDMLAQEGHVMRAAGCAGPLLDPEDINYTREVLAPFLDAGDLRTCIECLFGDEAGRTLGFTPRGLSRWAGLALAFHDAAQPLLESTRRAKGYSRTNSDQPPSSTSDQP